MARPTKTGMDYFPLDVALSDEVEAVEAVHENDGFAVIIKTWQAMYKTEDGRLDCSSVLWRKTLAKKSNLTEEKWLEIIATCVEVGLFDRESWENDMMLVSSGVRKRIQKVAEERQRWRKKGDKGGKTPGESQENDGGSNVIHGENLGDPGVIYADNPRDNPRDKGGNRNRKGNRKEEDKSSSPCNMSSQGPEPDKSLPAAFRESSYRDEAYEFVEWFRTIAPESVKFDRDKWAMVWYHLRSTDARADKEELIRAIRWARGDPFWSSNFHSPLKLRKRNDEGVMYIDVFIEKMRQSKQQQYAGSTKPNGRLGHQKPLDRSGAERIAAKIANDPRFEA